MNFRSFVLINIIIFQIIISCNIKPNKLSCSQIKNIKRLDLFEKSYPIVEKNINYYDPEIIEANAYIILPDNIKIIIPAFYFENYKRTIKNNLEMLIPGNTKEWKFRYTPRITGKYKYYFEIINHQNQNIIRIPEQGFDTFNVISSNSNGFLKVSLTDSHFLEYENGELYIGIGHNLCGWEWPGKYIDEAWNGTDNKKGTYEYDLWLNKMEENGANLCQFDFCESDQLEWTNHPDEFPFSNEWNGLINYNQKTAWKMDYLIRQAEKKGIFYRLTLLHWEDFDKENDTSPHWGWNRNPYNKKNGGSIINVSKFFTDPESIKTYKKQLRYIIARWGYSKNLFAFELWNEIDGEMNWGTGNYKTNKKNIIKWHNEISEYIKEHDINNHLITTSYADSKLDNEMWALKNIDISTIHRYTFYNSFNGDIQFLTFDTIVKLINNRYNDINKPVIIGEFALTPGGDLQRLYDKKGTAFHNQLWTSLMSKGAITAMHWNWGSYIDKNNLYYHYRGISSFFKNEDLRNTLSFNNLTHKYSKIKFIGLIKPQLALIWIKDKNYNYEKIKNGYKPTEINNENILIDGMENNNYNITFFNTITGEAVKYLSLKAINGKLDIKIPKFTKDIAVKIKPE